MEGYMTISEASAKWGIGHRRISKLCKEGRIDGAMLFGCIWAIPVSAQRPADLRIKSGKYIKKKADKGGRS